MSASPISRETPISSFWNLGNMNEEANEKNREVSKWADRINARQAVKSGLDVPEKFKMKEKMKTKEGEEEYAKHHSSWVMKGQEKDQETHK